MCDHRDWQHFRSPLKCINPIRIQRPPRTTSAPQKVQMCDCLANGKYQLMFIEGTAKQNRQYFSGVFRRLYRDFKFAQPQFMMMAQLGKAFVEPGENPVVRRQHQRVGGQGLKLIHAIEKLLERIGFGLITQIGRAHV